MFFSEGQLSTSTSFCVCVFLKHMLMNNEDQNKTARFAFQTFSPFVSKKLLILQYIFIHSVYILLRVLTKCWDIKKQREQSLSSKNFWSLVTKN